ncbi:MAG: hypothetical protein JXR84_25685 [Anaerolineae bacterium]|nr:hypothetical protein [Anaerolineae bacterium]
MNTNRMRGYANQMQQNALIRRVRRHATMATLFRSADVTPAPVAQSQIASVAMPVGPTVDELVPALPYTQEETPLSSRAPSRAMVPGGPSPVALSAVQRRQEPTPSPLTVSTQTAVPTTVADKDQSSTDDASWRRLKTIFRKHQERAEAAAQQTPEVSPAASQVGGGDTISVSEPYKRVVQETEANDISTSLASAHFSESRTTPPPSVAQVHDVKRVPGSETVQEEESPYGLLGESSASTLQAKEHETEPRSKEAGHVQLMAEQPSLPVPPTRAESMPTIQQNEHLHPEPRTSIESAPHVFPAAASTEDAEQSSYNVHALPLQAMWPVERHTEATSRQPPALSSTTPSGEESPMPVADAQVLKALDAIAPQHPTASSIDVVMPRRPRPVVTSLAQSTRSGRAVDARVGASPLSVQTKAESSPEATNATTDPMVQTDIGLLPADLWPFLGEPSPAEKRNFPVKATVPSRTPTAPSSGAATEIKTEALPEPTSSTATDRLQAPAFTPIDTGSGVLHTNTPISRHRFTHSGPSQTIVQTAPVVREQPSPPSPTKASVSDSPLVDAVSDTSVNIVREPQRDSPVIQRQPELSSTTSTLADVMETRPEQSGSLGTNTEDTMTEPESKGPDLDELARQVYGEVKRRLAVEWERFRQCF